VKNITLTIDSNRITAPEGDNVLWVALDNGIYIPNLCALKDKAEPEAACRLCFVEIDGREQPATACTETVTDGMVVNTRGAEALRLAHAAFELLMASHPVECARCPANRACELQMIARHLGVKLKSKRYRKLLRDLPVDDSSPVLTYDPNKCVLCGRCVWVCRQRLGIGVLGFAHRGFRRMVTTFGDEPLAESGCERCGDCITVCPTGALTLKGEATPVRG